jgi:hypothetical protein
MTTEIPKTLLPIELPTMYPQKTHYFYPSWYSTSIVSDNVVDEDESRHVAEMFKRLSTLSAGFVWHTYIWKIDGHILFDARNYSYGSFQYRALDSDDIVMVNFSLRNVIVTAGYFKNCVFDAAVIILGGHFEDCIFKVSNVTDTPMYVIGSHEGNVRGGTFLRCTIETNAMRDATVYSSYIGQTENHTYPSIYNSVLVDTIVEPTDVEECVLDQCTLQRYSNDRLNIYQSTIRNNTKIDRAIISNESSIEDSRIARSTVSMSRLDGSKLKDVVVNEATKINDSSFYGTCEFSNIQGKDISIPGTDTVTWNNDCLYWDENSKEFSSELHPTKISEGDFYE